MPRFLPALCEEAGVDAQYVVEDEVGTGVGHVVVDTHGDYSIIVARANGNLSPQDIDKATSAFAGKFFYYSLRCRCPVTYAAQKSQADGTDRFSQCR
ncbi:MAG: hypothetical protein U0401_17755 [Anaerolineae bacterium]